MVITLSGDNWFLTRDELNRLVAEFRSSNDELGLEKLDSQDLSLEDLKHSLNSYSLFSPRRLMVLMEPSKIKLFSEQVEQIIEDLPETTDLIIIEPTLDKRQSYYKFLVKSTDFRTYPKLVGPKLIDWMLTFTKSIGGNINRSQAAHLVERIGEDQLLISSELNKLVLYSKDLTNENIDLLTEQSPASTIFQLLDAAFSGSTKSALRLYAEQRTQKVEPEQVLSMLSWQVHILALSMASKNLSFDELVSRTKLSPFTVQKANQIASKLTFSGLKAIVHDLTQMDLRTKTEGFDLDEGLKNFIVGLSLAG